mgnify:CR=1 FL=1
MPDRRGLASPAMRLTGLCSALSAIARLAASLVVVWGLMAARADAKPSRTWNYLTTGNGHGFQVYDSSRNKLTHFLEHPYRYLRPSPGDPRGDGIGRRQLAYDVYFGLRAAGGGGWLNEAAASEPGYVEETNIIRAPLSLAGVSAEVYHYAPFGFEGNASIALLKAPGATDGFVLLNFHLGDGAPDPAANGESLRAVMSGGQLQAVIETGPGGGAMIYVPLSPIAHADCDGIYNKVKNGQPLGDNTGCRGNDIVPAFQATLTDGWMGVAMLYSADAAQAETMLANFKSFIGGKTPSQILEAGLAEWRAWRKPPDAKLALCSDDEKRLWRQSEAVLRMGQVREPYLPNRKNYGMVLASLPVGEWHTGWVRDAMYAIVALARMGHHEEARMALEFFLNADPVGKFKSYVRGQDYRLSVVRYFGNGEEEADYSGQPTPNVEIDGWGMVLWAARQYVESSGNTAWLSQTTRLGPTVLDALTGGVGKPLAANLEPSGIAKADSSIWEVHVENDKHFAYTTLATIRGFCDLAALLKKGGRETDSKTYRDLSTKARAGFFATFLDRDGAIAGSTEELGMNQYLDGAVVEAFTWNVLKDSEYSERTGKATLDLIDRLRVPSGGYKRNDDGKSSYDNNEWILIDLRVADAQWRAGREADARNSLQPVIEKAAANFYLLPELYNAVAADGMVGKYTGSIPMVGYGGGAYVLTMLDRSGLIEANDCGDGMGNKSSGRTLTCNPDDPGGPGTPGNPGAPPAPTAEELPYADACLCSVPPGHAHGGSRAWPLGAGSSGLGLLLILLVRRRRQGASERGARPMNGGQR